MKYSVKNEDPDRLDGRGEGGLPKRVNIKAEERRGVDGAGRAASQKTRAKQICELELREQPLRRD